MFKTLKTVIRTHSSIRSEFNASGQQASRSTKHTVVIDGIHQIFPLSTSVPGSWEDCATKTLRMERGHVAISDQVVVSKYHSLENQSIHFLVQSPAVSLWQSSQEPLTWLDCKGNQAPLSPGIGDERGPPANV